MAPVGPRTRIQSFSPFALGCGGSPMAPQPALRVAERGPGSLRSSVATQVGPLRGPGMRHVAQRIGRRCGAVGGSATDSDGCREYLLAPATPEAAHAAA